MFSDRARIRVQAGRGGDGSLHFRREKHVPKGGPDGGDGGPGGDVVLVADPNLRDLSAYRTRRWFQGGNGEPGRGALKHGATGETVEVRVPVGTQVFDEDGQLIADLASPQARIVAARGGIAGRGNKRFATPTRRTPRFAETGLPGEEAELELHLKLLADAALAGLPNAGKSSLLTRISNARPKVADYPFTTVAPVLGTVDAPDSTRQLVVADVPGLLEGASEGVGLGHEFLAHLERARLLLHLVEAAAGAEDVAKRRAAIDRELALHGGGLGERPQLIVLSKIDLVPPQERASLVEATGADVACSAATGEGIADLQRALWRAVPVEAPVLQEAEPELADFLVYRPKPHARREFRILRDGGVLRVAGRGLERRVADLDPEDAGSVAVLASELERLGVDRALHAAGARPGDDVLVGAHRFTYRPRR